jgi:hypothetical protein
MILLVIHDEESLRNPTFTIFSNSPLLVPYSRGTDAASNSHKVAQMMH